MTNNTKQAKRKGTIKLATPVPFVGLEHKDLVAVSLEDLVEAQKEHEKEVKKAKLEVINFIEGWAKNTFFEGVALIDHKPFYEFIEELKKEVKGGEK